MSMEHSLKNISDATALIKDTVGASSFVSDLCDYIDKQFFTMCIAQQKYIKEIEEQREQIEINKRLEKQRLLGVQANNQIRVMEKQIDFLKAHIDYLKEYKEEAVE